MLLTSHTELNVHTFKQQTRLNLSSEVALSVCHSAFQLCSKDTKTGQLHEGEDPKSVLV